MKVNQKVAMLLCLSFICLGMTACSGGNEASITEPAVYQELADPDIFNLRWDMSKDEVMLQEVHNNIINTDGICTAEQVEYADKQWKVTYEFDSDNKFYNAKCEYIGDDDEKAFEELTEYFLERNGLGLMTDVQAAWRGSRYDILMELEDEDSLILNIGRRGTYYSYFSEYERRNIYPAAYAKVFYCYKNAVGSMTLDRALEVAVYGGIPATLTKSGTENGRNLITITDGGEYAVNVYTADKEGEQIVSEVQLKRVVSSWDYALEMDNASHSSEIRYAVVDYGHGLTSRRMSYDTLDEAAEAFLNYQSEFRKDHPYGKVTSADIGTPSSLSLTVPHGEVLDVNITGDTLIVKTKITSSFSNHSTISQNFFNLEDLIKNQGCSAYDEIQYWAVADMSDGSESKVVSFTAPKSTIDGIKDGSIDAIAYLDEYGYLEDVYILPSLQE